MNLYPVGLHAVPEAAVLIPFHCDSMGAFSDDSRHVGIQLGRSAFKRIKQMPAMPNRRRSASKGAEESTQDGGSTR